MPKRKPPNPAAYRCPHCLETVHLTEIVAYGPQRCHVCGQISFTNVVAGSPEEPCYELVKGTEEMVSRAEEIYRRQRNLNARIIRGEEVNPFDILEGDGE